MYVLVCTSTYQYIPVQTSTGISDRYVLVRTGTYWYVPVRTRNKTRGFLIHPGSASRVNCNSVLLPCMRYDRIQISNFKKIKVQVRRVQTGMYWYVLVRTGIDINHTRTSFRCCFRRSPTQASLHCTLGLFHAQRLSSEQSPPQRDHPDGAWQAQTPRAKY